MRLSYDKEGDVLEVIFDERLHRAPKKAYRLRQGIVLYVSVDTMKPVQLTLVSYRALAQFPVIQFAGWQALPASDRELLLPIINSPAISAFLRLDPETGHGHIASADVLDILPAIA